MAHLCPYKAPGIHLMSPFFLKSCYLDLVDPITYLFSTCLASCSLPKEWKVHKIVPIHKRGSRSEVANYRPISLLCVLSKVLESIYDKIIDFIYPQLSHSQFGFLRNRSCLTQLLSSFSSIYDAVEEKASCDVVFLDFRNAFDSIPHSELLFKLWQMGTTGPLWCWFQSYLSGRSHLVSIEDSLSDPLHVYSRQCRALRTSSSSKEIW